MKNFCFSIIIISLFYSCNNEVKPLVFKTEVISEDLKINSEISFNEVDGNDAISNKINATLQNKIAALIPNSENQTTIKDAVLAFDNEYTSFVNDFSNNEHVWELHIETEVIYQSEEIITIVVNVYSDTGGAHGNDTIQLLNFNTETGALYDHSNIINDIEGFKSIAETYFIKSIKNDSESTSISEFFFGKSFQLPENIGFSEDGIVLLYNTYEVSTFNQGFTEFVIPFEEANPYLKIN
ncbi:DUF3298 and DUF4163 domain-containing protein [Winogradskyella immobilis]|uniref:DUF4163 domain-containing protein n=1 Tax=Winogradskyella immobilis TaxID=2816852 RepID=A0ABS8EQF3_9FLAO|nr:DUF3298 and DUF4163 domain-containing protein [Winogradskyella immobilis]MCC1485469.1 DUF4163 domain-containing protein [Winogradskyella immobilis]MCG0017561.1 DUF3298 and DUF4163 domain-containing protein [Winogradskyella immobilis]